MHMHQDGSMWQTKTKKYLCIYTVYYTTSPFDQFKGLFAKYIVRDGRGHGIKRRKGGMEL